MVTAGLFFFSSRRRHTRCSRDWSSDVCSSDLMYLIPVAVGDFNGDGKLDLATAAVGTTMVAVMLGNGEDRKRVVEGKSVDLGGRRFIKKKKKERERLEGATYNENDESHL